LIASKLQQLTPTNHQPHGDRVKKLKKNNNKSKYSICTTKDQMKCIVIHTIHPGRTTQTSDGEITIPKTNNHGRGIQTNTTQEATKITTSSRLTKTPTENLKTTTPTSTNTNLITNPPTKMPTIHHPHLITHLKYHLKPKESLTWRP